MARTLTIPFATPDADRFQAKDVRLSFAPPRGTIARTAVHGLDIGIPISKLTQIA